MNSRTPGILFLSEPGFGTRRTGTSGNEIPRTGRGVRPSFAWERLDFILLYAKQHETGETCHEIDRTTGQDFAPWQNTTRRDLFKGETT
jgi:hypothetical protein